jgi:hypothetical protein
MSDSLVINIPYPLYTRISDDIRAEEQCHYCVFWNGAVL